MSEFQIRGFCPLITLKRLYLIPSTGFKENFLMIFGAHTADERIRSLPITEILNQEKRKLGNGALGLKLVGPAFISAEPRMHRQLSLIFRQIPQILDRFTNLPNSLTEGAESLRNE